MEIFNPSAKIYANVDRVIEFLETGNTSPVTVEIDPANACNMACVFCISNYIHHTESKELETFDRSIMSKEMLLSICKDMVEMDVRAINWTGGGEPTLNPYLAEALYYIKNNSSIKMGMFTNGCLFSRYDMYDALVQCMSWIRISIDAGTPETYNSVRRVDPHRGWNLMVHNLFMLLQRRDIHKTYPDIGVGFVITPDNYEEIVDFAKFFSRTDVDYAQFKPEIVNREREDGIQREVEFWTERVKPLLDEAKSILGSKFQINDYKLLDLTEDTDLFGRNYKKCFGSQIQPCIGADGEVYVCTNHRGYKEYSYGNLKDEKFITIWNNIINRRRVMSQIEDDEKFKNCTQLCKPNESSKAIWQIYQTLEELKGTEGYREYKLKLLEEQEEHKKQLTHPEFI